jgi:hypothetical protein
MSFDPNVKYLVDKAMAEARTGDSRTRLLMRVESDAKRLALSIVEYEEYVQAEMAHQHQDVDDQQVDHAQDASMEDPEDGP